MQQPSTRAYVALASVCFFWGTTYVAIRMALESLAPFTLMAVRFTLSGTILLVGAKLLGHALPQGREFWRTALHGLLLLGVSNSCLTFAELTVPSGLASLIITVVPFWLVGLEAALPGGERLHPPALLAMLVGFVGVVLLLNPTEVLHHGFNAGMLQGILLLQVSSFSWAFGSILQRRVPPAAGPIVAGGVQQLAVGVVSIPLALLLPHSASTLEPRGLLAMAFLVVFGSIVGYSSYVYALSKLPIAVVSLYSYVNPVVAVTLGWMLYREPFGPREGLAMTLVFAGVALVKRFSQPRPVPLPVAAKEPA